VDGENEEIYVGMQGASEFTISGALGDFNVTGRLHEIEVPVLLTSGRFDTMRPSIVETMYQNIRLSEWETFKKSGHISMIDEPGEMNQVVHDFLTRVEAPRVVLVEEDGVFVTKPWNGNTLQESNKQEFVHSGGPLSNNDANATTITTGSKTRLEIMSTLLVAILVAFLMGLAVGHNCLPIKKGAPRNDKNGYTPIA
jgi:hypothetical protein